MIDKQLLNKTVNCGKTLKFAEAAQICEFCKSRNADKKFTALIYTIIHNNYSFSFISNVGDLELDSMLRHLKN